MEVPPLKLLLHACCCPCTLEPLRLLLEEGHDIAIAYMNSNIHPAEEYEHRRAVLLDFAREQGLEVIEGVYDPQVWSRAVGVFGTDPDQRPDRCRACYRLRLEEACAYAAANGFEGVATTLTVSPYQYTETIREELERACEPHGLAAVFRDYREQYPEATRRSKAMGMYRQNYCGCVFSKIELRKNARLAKPSALLRRLPRKPPRPPRVRPPKLPARRSAPKSRHMLTSVLPNARRSSVQASASRRCGLLRKRKQGGIAQS